MSLDATTVVDAFALGLTYAEASLGFGQAAVDWVGAIQADMGAAMTTACFGGGTRSLVLVDADGNQRLSSGDSIRVRLDDCYVQPLVARLAGEAVVQVLRTTPRLEATLSFPQPLAVIDEPARGRVTGQFDLTWANERLATTLTVASTRWTLTANPQPGVQIQDAVEAVQITRSVRRDLARAETIINARIISGELGGSFSIRTSAALSALFDRLPDTGRLVIEAANGSPSLLLDANGTGIGAITGSSFSASLNLAEATYGYLWSSYGVLPPPLTWFNPVQARANDFTILSSPDFGSIDPSQSLSWQLSRPVSDNSRLICSLEKLQAGSGFDWGAADPGCDVQVNGALITVSARSQLVPGDLYGLRFWVTEGGAPSPFFFDGRRNPLAINDQSFRVRQTVSASAMAGLPGFIIGPGTLDLRADQSMPAAGYSWSVLSGPATVELSDRPVALLVPVPGAANGEAVIELTVRNARSEIDKARVVVPVIASPDRALFASWRRANDPMILSFDPTGKSPDYSARGTAREILVDVGFTTRLFRVLLTAPAGQSFQPGRTYTFTEGVVSGTSASGAVLVGDVICTLARTTVVLHEFDPLPANELARLALDFERDCDGIVTRGSVRYKSARAPIQ